MGPSEAADDVVGEGTAPVDAGGVARRVAVAGLAVTQAAEELQRAGKVLTAIEEQVREAEERSQRAEEQLQAARERVRLAEEQLHVLETQLEQLENHPQVTVIVDKERDALQQAVAAGVRRPLTSILGLTLALKHHDPNSPDGKEMLRQLSTHARKLDRLVGQLVDLDKLVNGTLAPNRRRTDLGALVGRVIEETPDLVNREVRFEPAERVVIAVDPVLAEQMVDALLANAGRRAVPGARVWVKVEPYKDGAVIAVEDAGTEVPEGLRQALLASLQEKPGVETRRMKGATGLSLLSRLAEIHGGRAWVEERQGGGASFRVFLPSVAEEATATSGDGPGAAAAAAPERREPAHGALEGLVATGGEEGEAIAI